MNMHFIESENGIALKHFSCFLTFERYSFHYIIIYCTTCSNYRMMICKFDKTWNRLKLISQIQLLPFGKISSQYHSYICFYYGKLMASTNVGDYTLIMKALKRIDIYVDISFHETPATKWRAHVL